MTAPDTTIPFDRSHLSTFTGGDMALERELLEDFLHNARVHIDTLEASLGLPIWGENAHRLKGASSGVGMKAMAHICSAAEALPFENIADGKTLIDKMVGELAKLRQYLSKG